MYLVLKKKYFTKYFWIQIGINWSYVEISCSKFEVD